MKGKTCCVTGHRDLPQNEINKIKAALEHEIDAAVTDGFTCFMSGFADGVDQYFAELVLERKQTKRVFTYELITDLVWKEDCDFYSRKAIISLEDSGVFCKDGAREFDRRIPPSCRF